MVLVEMPQRFCSFDARKKFGRPNKYGQAIYGVSQFGEDNDLTGIYQTRHYKGGKYTVRENFYVPTETTKRINDPNRVTFANAVLAWQGLTSEQKEVYRIKSSGKNMSGYNVFLHEYLISH